MTFKKDSLHFMPLVCQVCLPVFHLPVLMNSGSRTNNNMEEIESWKHRIPSGTSRGQNAWPCFNGTRLLIPTWKFSQRFSANTGSSEVRVSKRAAALQLTWIRGLGPDHFTTAEACQHGHRVCVIQGKNSASDLEVSSFQTGGSWNVRVSPQQNDPDGVQTHIFSC